MKLTLNPRLGILPLLLMPCFSLAQLLSMNFNVDSATTLIGPTIVSISASAGTLPGGSNGKGLAAQRNGTVLKRDINMDFANTDNYWDVSGIDLSLDFNREESVADFFTRLSNGFRFGIDGGNLFVNYQVSDGLGGSTTVSSGAIQAVPNDDIWRRYRFTYDPNTGVGIVFVNGISVWTNDGPDNRPMFWTGAGAFRIGNLLDASGSVEAVIDSIFITSINVLPVALSNFEGKRNDNAVLLSWETQSEVNNERFVIERKLKDKNQEWQIAGTLPGKINSNATISYAFEDKDAPNGELIYRLKQIDLDGVFKYSEEILIGNSPVGNSTGKIIYPNPVKRGELITVLLQDLRYEQILLLNSNGTEILRSRINHLENQLQIPANLNAGLYYIQLIEGSEQTAYRLMVE